MKKVILSLILVLSTVMSMAQSLDVSHGDWTVEKVKIYNVDTILCEVNGYGFFRDMNNLYKNEEYVIICNRLGLNTLNLPVGNFIQEEFLFDYRMTKLERKQIKFLRKELKNVVVQFYEVNEYGEKIIPTGRNNTYQFVL